MVVVDPEAGMDYRKGSSTYREEIYQPGKPPRTREYHRQWSDAPTEAPQGSSSPSSGAVKPQPSPSNGPGLSIPSTPTVPTLPSPQQLSSNSHPSTAILMEPVMPLDEDVPQAVIIGVEEARQDGNREIPADLPPQGFQSNPPKKHLGPPPSAPKMGQFGFDRTT